VKIPALTVLAGAGVSLILSGSADAGFVGITTTSKPNEFGIFAVNVYAVFDRPDPGDGSGDHMVAVAGRGRYAERATDRQGPRWRVLQQPVRE